MLKSSEGFSFFAMLASFETVEEQIAERLKASVEERALRQFVSILAGQAEIMGVDLEGAETPLVQ